MSSQGQGSRGSRNWPPPSKWPRRPCQKWRKRLLRPRNQSPGMGRYAELTSTGLRNWNRGMANTPTHRDHRRVAGEPYTPTVAQHTLLLRRGYWRWAVWVGPRAPECAEWQPLTLWSHWLGIGRWWHHSLWHWDFPSYNNSQ